MPSIKYPPYVNAYGNLSRLLTKIKAASVPRKITRDFVSTVLGLKSSSYQPMIPLLKKLGFIDQTNTPTQRYKDFRSETKSGFVMAKALGETYKDIYQAHEYAHKLSKKELIDNLVTTTGASKDDKIIPTVVGTFQELVKHATFDVAEVPEGIVEESEEEESAGEVKERGKVKFGISYTINLNLPATTEVKLFDAIFKSLKKNIIDNQSVMVHCEAVMGRAVTILACYLVKYQKYSSEHAIKKIILPVDLFMM